MDILHVFQDSATAPVFVALICLPWLNLAVMQALSLANRDALDDNFSARAGAALRWADQNPDPATPARSAVLEYRVRAQERKRAGGESIIEDEAA